MKYIKFHLKSFAAYCTVFDLISLHISSTIYYSLYYVIAFILSNIFHQKTKLGVSCNQRQME